MSTKPLILLAALSFLTAGCGKKDTQGGVTVEQKGNVSSVELKGKDGGAVMKAEASEKGVSLPPDFPKDVPLFKDALVIAAVVVGDTFQVQTTFKAPVAEALNFYAEKLKSEGWDVQIAREQGETGIISAEKGNRECRVRLSKDDQLTVAMIMTSAAGK